MNSRTRWASSRYVFGTFPTGCRCTDTPPSRRSGKRGAPYPAEGVPHGAYAGPRYTAERSCIRLSSSSIRPSANPFRPIAKLSGNCIDNECPDNLRYGPADMYRVDYISEEFDPQASCIQGFYIKVSCVQFSCIKSGGKSL